MAAELDYCSYIMNLIKRLVRWSDYYNNGRSFNSSDPWYCPLDLSSIVDVTFHRGDRDIVRNDYVVVSCIVHEKDCVERWFSEYKAGRTDPKFWDEMTHWFNLGSLYGGQDPADYHLYMKVPLLTETDAELRNLISEIKEQVTKEYPNNSNIHISTPFAASGGGCYVATAIYGSYDCPEVWTLRRFRDQRLAETVFGRAFIRAYYAVSPTVVRYFGSTAAFSRFFRKRLDRLVARLQREGMESTPYRDK